MYEIDKKLVSIKNKLSKGCISKVKLLTYKNFFQLNT